MFNLAREVLNLGHRGGAGFGAAAFRKRQTGANAFSQHALYRLFRKHGGDVQAALIQDQSALGYGDQGLFRRAARRGRVLCQA